MRYQQTDYYCGPAALQNALKALRKHVTQDRIAELAGTSPAEGTDEDGIKRATIALGYGVDEIATDDRARARNLLTGSLLVGRPVLLCVDRWGHWVTAIAMAGTAVVVAEPARFPHTQRENGILVVTQERLLRRWRAGRTRHKGLDRPRYYGIAIGPLTE